MTQVAFWLVRTTYTWDKAYGRPCIVVSFEGLQTLAVLRADCREVVLSSLAREVYLYFLLFCFTGQSCTVQEYVRVRVQSPAYIGYSPTDDLSVDCRRMGYFVSDTLGRTCLNKVYETRGSKRVVSHYCTPAGMINLFE